MAERKTETIIVTDGSLDWSQGVNSDVVTTIQSQQNPNGLMRNQVSWMDNATVRGGGIIQRLGWANRGTVPTIEQYQGQFMYRPDVGDPYLVVVLGGHVWKVPVDDAALAEDLSATFNLVHPVTPRVFFEQAEQFLIIQAGDNVTLPLFWDGQTLRRSKGITNTAVAPGTPGVNEIPAGTSMRYYMGRLWYAQGRTASAGDIVGGQSGTAQYNLRDAVLNVTENPLCVGGDGFSLPANSGNIRGIAFSSNLNTQLGQGTLYIGTREEIFALTVPVTRTDWIAANSSNQPLLVVALDANGWVSDRSIVAVNGDLFFQSLEPSIRSLTVAVRNFQQWGNVPISTNEQRIMTFVDRNLLQFGSGIYFDNRLLQTSLPYITPVGVAHSAIIPLNFDVISTFQEKLPPVWEGMWEGMPILEMSTGDFGGRQRAFASVWSDQERNIQLWEFTTTERWDNKGDTRVDWYIEFPAFTWGNEFRLKKLVAGELWIDKLLGEVVFKMEYRPDGDPCWYGWHVWKFCTAKDCTESVHAPVCVYPQSFRESYRQTVTLPIPPRGCEGVMGRPVNLGYQFQCRLTIKGWCRIRGLMLHAEEVERKLYSNMVC